ncbi:uncharacterized protein LY79DRAFT_390738 [Colletotrichum navitas]|uniref:Uncharacterized protein n=1 Tax=Colletotrichum navitas TaxID=681940 RepID=A0AAD8PQJ2_9PEZI|nr:uncharacterized protein LY79DRAFT_390738 [Colletotrichum navitas]KAK1574143.1 hypothetical protein LY79DRAFT_390738 [Colletotrichum navitas]
MAGLFLFREVLAAMNYGSSRPGDMQVVWSQAIGSHQSQRTEVATRAMVILPLYTPTLRALSSTTISLAELCKEGPAVPGKYGRVTKGALNLAILDSVSSFESQALTIDSKEPTNPDLWSDCPLMHLATLPHIENGLIKICWRSEYITFNSDS